MFYFRVNRGFKYRLFPLVLFLITVAIVSSELTLRERTVNHNGRIVTHRYIQRGGSSGKSIVTVPGISHEMLQRYIPLSPGDLPDGFQLSSEGLQHYVPLTSEDRPNDFESSSGSRQHGFQSSVGKSQSGFQSNKLTSAASSSSGKSNHGQKDIAKLFDHPYRCDPQYLLNKKTMRISNVAGNTLATSKHDIKPEILEKLMRLDREEPFSPRIKKHSRIATDLIKIFMDAPTYNDVVATANKYRSLLNPNMFIYALSVALLHRDDTEHLEIPPLTEAFPDKYVDSRIFRNVREAVSNVSPGEPIEIWQNYSTASNLEAEHRVAYFREDIGVNLHHWTWHLIYPFEGDPRIVIKDRRGELFYFMHQQILARFNAERLCNNIGHSRRLNNFEEPIAEGYFPKLDSRLSSRNWPSRPSGLLLKDINRPGDDVQFDIQDLERWRDRIDEAITTGSVVNKTGQRVVLDEKHGIDILGNAIESSPILSPNFEFYGQLHNQGHMAIAFSHDPINLYLETFGIMGDSATAMRDPIFYRWHTFINTFFSKHKDSLTPYTVRELNYPDIEISGVQTINTKKKINRLDTFWSNSVLDLSRGLDFNSNSTVRVKFTHLNHEEYNYRIVVTNKGRTTKNGVVRIFIAPKFDESGLPFNFNAERVLMIDMDKFNVKLQPGKNVIERSSIDAAVTVPSARHNRQLSFFTNTTLNLFSGCGWPQHMLLPRGTRDGFPMVLFVMISNDILDTDTQDDLTRSKSAWIFCGLRRRKYPDSRAMGFPFDRRGRDGVTTLSQFLTRNMAITDITVYFNDVIV